MKIIFFSLIYWSMKNYDDKKFIKHQINKKFLYNFRAFSNLINNKPKDNLNYLIKNTNLKKRLGTISDKKINLKIDLNKNYNLFYNDINKLLNFIKQKPEMDEMARFVKKLKYLFKGTCGLGLNYFIFKKK